MEATVADPKLVNPFSDMDDKAPRACPPLTVMSLAIRTVVNHQLSTREIVTTSIRVWENSELFGRLTFIKSSELTLIDRHDRRS